MDRHPQPPLPPSSSMASTGPEVITLRLRVRPRGGPAPPPPLLRPPATATGTTAPRLVSAADGAVDGDGLKTSAPPATATGTTAPHLVSAADGAVDGEDLKTAGSPATATGTTAPRLVSTAAGDVDGEGERPPPLTRRSTPEEDAPSPFTLLPEDIVLHVASRLRSSRQDFERMRSVCPSWREAIPSTIEPFLVLSKKDPEVDSEILLLEVARTKRAEDAAFVIKLPLSRPPVGTSCWGSALGLLALQSHPISSGETFVYCIHCANRKSLLSMPMRTAPKGLFLEPYTPQRFVLMAIAGGGDAILRVDADGFPWMMEEGGPWWLPMPGFGDTPLSSLALSPGVLRAGASKDCILIIDESGRALDSQDKPLQLQAPPLYHSDGTPINPWEENGQHLFLCENQLYFVQIFDSLDAPEGIGVQLYLVEKSGGADYSLLPTMTIGEFSVFLGANQSFVLPSASSLVGRLANTLYIEDFRSYNRRPRVLAINFESLKTLMIPFPEDIAAVDECLPAVWVGLPHHSDLVNHCQVKDCWRFWE